MRIGVADTIGAACAVSRYGSVPILETCMQVKALSSLPPSALRLDFRCPQSTAYVTIFLHYFFLTDVRQRLDHQFLQFFS